MLYAFKLSQMFSLFNFPYNLKGLIEDERIDELQQVSFLEWSHYFQKEKGMTPDELARQLSYSPHEWEGKFSSTNFPSINKLEILLRLLNE